MTYSLHHPPAGLTGFPRLIWPLVYAQLIVLKAWVRGHYGPGVPYWYTVSRWGRVALCHLPIDFAHSDTAPGALTPTVFDFTLARPSPRLALALTETNCTLAPRADHDRRPRSVYGLLCHALWDSS